MNDIKMEGVSFNKAWLEGFASETAFLSEMQKPEFEHLYPGENREAKLKTVYALVHGSKEETSIATENTGHSTKVRKTKIVGKPDEQSLAGGSEEG